MARPRVLLVSLLLAVVAVGCAPEDPYATDRPSPGLEQRGDGAIPARPSRPADGELAGAVPRESRPAPATPRGAANPSSALRRAARLYGTWTSATAPSRFRALAAMSVGEARAQLGQIAAQAGADTQQRETRSRSRIVSLTIRGSGPRRDAEIVTRDRVVGPGLPDTGTETSVVRATVVRRGSGWVIARWEPQP